MVVAELVGVVASGSVVVAASGSVVAAVAVMVLVEFVACLGVVAAASVVLL